MARKQQTTESTRTTWMLTFSDMMTLLLTFFVLLLSMAVIDERSRLAVLGSVTTRFGDGGNIFNPLSPEKNARLRDPGPMQAPEQDLAVLRDMVVDEAEKDLNFQENRYVQIISINEKVLFEQGKTELTPRGKALLNRFLPVIQQIEHPLLVAGHTGPRRDEEGGAYRVAFDSKDVDSTWLLSFQRAMSVYRHFTEAGIRPQKLSLEAFGQFHPRYSNNTPEGRDKNRRVDLVLDKRNREWIRKVEEYQKTVDFPQEELKHFYRGFEFNLTMPGTSGGASESDNSRLRPGDTGDVPDLLPPRGGR